MENILFNELIFRGYSVDVGVIRKMETDKNGKRSQKTFEIAFIVNAGEDLPKLDLANGSYDSLIHWANGETTTITYTASNNPAITNDATGYLLDEFKENADIYLVMTTLPSEGSETVDTYQYVKDADHDTTMLSRQHNTLDLADNVRINFGIDNVGAREFVAVYTGTDRTPSPSGQPLPGLLFAGMLSLGTVFAASKMRKRS